MKLYTRISARFLTLVLIAFTLLGVSSCGGGGGSSSTTGGDPGGSALTITTDSVLPGTLTGHAYTTTLTAAHGKGALTWSIAAVNATALFPQGISIDPSTGVLSGTSNFGGTSGFIATVKDGSGQVAQKGFYLTAYAPLSAPASTSMTLFEYVDSSYVMVNYQGGVPSVTFALTGGALPPGVRVDASSGALKGSPLAAGNYSAVVTIQDSFSPKESVTQTLNITVRAPQLSLAFSVPTRLPVNVPYSGAVVAQGGVPPYAFSIITGSLPPGLGTLDANNGTFSGTPNTAGSYYFVAQVTDSGTPPQASSTPYSVVVGQALGRNDSIQTATPVSNGNYEASISPYIDPPDRAPLAADNDYYKVTSLAGSIVNVQTYARGFNANNPLDTVLEILDGNGVRLNTCNQPGNANTNYTSACINDDRSTTSTDSMLDIKVPGDASTTTSLYVHVFDWRGDARPDMRYALSLNGVVAGLQLQQTPPSPAARGLSYSQQLSAANGNGTLSWSIASGALPPGLTLGSDGSISGVATTDGDYVFAAKVADSSTPPQTASGQFHVQVVEPVVITSPATWPDACATQPYSFTMQTSGGAPPIVWGFVSSSWIAINLNQSTGVFSGQTNVTGTFQGRVLVTDATTHGVFQDVSLTVKTCP